MNPEYVYKQSEQAFPNHYMNGFAFVPYCVLPQQLQHVYNQMLVTINDKADKSLDDYETEIYNTLNSQNDVLSVFLTRKDCISDTVFNNEISERESMIAVFPIVFIVISLLTILTTMSRMIRNQRTQIGVLKALGFSRRKIMLHYVSYGVGLTFTGGMLGLIAGPLLLPMCFYGPMRTTYTLPVWRPSLIMSSFAVLAGTVITAGLVAYITCYKILREKPAQALRPKAPSTIKPLKIEGTKLWKKANAATQWNFRDIIKSKARSIMAVVGVAGCMGLMIMPFGCLNVFDSMVLIKYDKICKYSNKYTLNEDITDAQISNILSQTDGIGVMESEVEIKSENEKDSALLFVLDKTPKYQFLGRKWENISLPDEGVALSKKMADALKVSEGDIICWHIYGDNTWCESKVTCIYRDPSQQGMAMTKSELADNNHLFKPTAVLAAILAIVVLYNLGVLSFSEKERELATLKVLGFQTVQIRKLLLMQNIWLTVVGIPIGYYVGILILNTIMASMGTEFDLAIRVTPLSIVFSIVFTIILSIGVNYMFSGKLKKLDMVSALKGVE